jgi:hypothetical protein
MSHVLRNLSFTEYKCHNPSCPKSNKRFQSERAYSLYLLRSTECRAHVQENLLGTSTIPTDKQPSTNSTISGTPLSTSLFTTTSNYHPPIRRDHVNTLYTSYAMSTNEETEECLGITLSPPTSYNDKEHALFGNSMTTNHDQLSNKQIYLDRPFPYTTDQKWTVALLQLLDEMNAPAYAFSNILKWARMATSENYSFYPRGGLSRTRNIDAIFRSLSNSTQLLPTTVPVVPTRPRAHSAL